MSGAGLPDAPGSPPGGRADDGPEPAGPDLPEVLHEQHEELSEWLARLPELHGAARCDVFLHVRRRLAVHHALEEVVVRPKVGRHAGAPTPEPPAPELEVAELCPIDSSEFDSALASVVAAHQRHARQQEAEEFPLLSGPLSPEESAVLDTATHLWWGDSDVYLGNTYEEMVLAAREQVIQAGETYPSTDS